MCALISKAFLVFRDVFIEVYSDYLERNSTDRLLNPEVLVSEATRNSLRFKYKIFPRGACPQIL